MKKIVIGGCRNFTNYNVFSQFVDHCLSRIKNTEEIVILSGHCKGTDKMAERYAQEHNYKCLIFPAKWNIYGSAAGPIRNKQMIDQADYVITFWDYSSKGTGSLIYFAKEYNIPLRIKDIREYV